MSKIKKKYLSQFEIKFYVNISGLAAASGRSEWKWESGKEYVYDYAGRLLTGVPELDSNHFSGLVSKFFSGFPKQFKSG